MTKQRREAWGQDAPKLTPREWTQMLPAKTLEARSGGCGGRREDKAGSGYPGVPAPKEEGETVGKNRYLKIKIWELTTSINSPSGRTGKNKDVIKDES